MSQSENRPNAMHTVVPLQFLAPGERASVDQLVGVPSDVHRLEELGLRRGTLVEMVQAGTPCIIRLGDSKFCFRSTEAVGVMVRVDESAAAGVPS